MSLRHAFRAKFRLDKDKESKDGEKENEALLSKKQFSVESLEEDENGTKLTRSNSTEDTSIRSSEDDLGLPASPQYTVGEVSEGSSFQFKDEEEKAVYEVQLIQLQEQLVTAMIENQNLASELSEFKEENAVDKLLHDLERERQRSKLLVEKLNEATRQKSVRKRTSSKKRTDGYMPVPQSGDMIDIAAEVTEEFEDMVIVSPVTPVTQVRPPDTYYQRAVDWFTSVLHEYMADFTEDPEPETRDGGENEPLAVKKLKENIKRFGNGSKPIYNTLKGLHDMLTWRIPSVTLIVFLSYMYAVWHGWLLPLALFLAIFRLFVNYLRYRGFNVNITYLRHVEEEHKDNDDLKELGMSDKFNLVLQVARKVQNTLGNFANSLEKIKNLLTWKHPEATKKLFTMLCVCFVLSCVLPGLVLLKMAGLFLGIKLFIINYMYERFPRFQQRHDSVYQIWKTLPTDTQLERFSTPAIERQALSTHQVEIEEIHDDSTLTLDSVTRDERTFCDLFSLPLSECPLSGWQSGRRCTLINKDKSFTAAFKHGKLYLTRSYLCFERSKTQASKNLMISLEEIMKMEKAKPYTWMPGAGMSIEISVAGHEKPYLFGALLNRDECFDSIVTNGIKGDMSWALEAATQSEKEEKSSANNEKSEKQAGAAGGSKPEKVGTPPPTPGKDREKKNVSIRLSDLNQEDDDSIVI